MYPKYNFFSKFFLVICLLHMVSTSFTQANELENKIKSDQPYKSNAMTPFTHNIMGTIAEQVGQCDMVVIGDSLVHGLFFQTPKKRIYIAGVGGSKVEDWFALTDIIMPHIKTKKVIIALGINNTVRNLPFDKDIFIKTYAGLCGMLKNYGVEEIVIANVLPVSETALLGRKYFNDEHIKTINQALKELAEKESYTYLDAHSQFANEKGFMPEIYTVDGVHLSLAGYDKWKTILFPGL